jgi:2Fe-2S ferredoxin
MTLRASEIVFDGDGPNLTLHVTIADGDRHDAPGAYGIRVMELIRMHGLPIRAECGGVCVCSTCHVRVPERWRHLLPPPSDEELARLDALPTADDTSRLSCQLLMTSDLDGLEVTVQPDSLSDNPRHNRS